MKRLGWIVGAGALFATSASAVGQQASGADEAILEQRIRTDLKNDPPLKDNKIDVTVDGAVATLRGTVDTEAERARAERIARLNGAAAVDDRLQVIDHRGKAR